MGNDLPPQVPHHRAQPPLHCVAHVGGKQHACRAAGRTGRDLCVCWQAWRNALQAARWSHPQTCQHQDGWGVAGRMGIDTYVLGRHAVQGLRAALQAISPTLLEASLQAAQAWISVCGRQTWTSMLCGVSHCRTCSKQKTGRLRCCMQTLTRGFVWLGRTWQSAGHLA